VRRVALLALLLAGCAHNSVARDVPTWESRGASVVRASIDIEAPPPAVWAVLADLSAYADWNPWILEATGELAEGARVDARVLLKGEERPAAHIVLHVEPPERLCWRDHGWTTAFAYGQRCRMLAATATGTRVSQELLIAGPFRATAMKRFGDAMQEGIDAELAALKRRVEASPP